jgi:hypothetical protein
LASRGKRGLRIGTGILGNPRWRLRFAAHGKRGSTVAALHAEFAVLDIVEGDVITLAGFFVPKSNLLAALIHRDYFDVGIRCGNHLGHHQRWIPGDVCNPPNHNQHD